MCSDAHSITLSLFCFICFHVQTLLIVFTPHFHLILFSICENNANIKTYLYCILVLKLTLYIPIMLYMYTYSKPLLLNMLFMLLLNKPCEKMPWLN